MLHNRKTSIKQIVWFYFVNIHKSTVNTKISSNHFVSLNECWSHCKLPVLPFWGVSHCLFSFFFFRHRRVPHLSWPLWTGQVRQHAGRLWMRVLWRLWEWLHDDEKLHGWVQSSVTNSSTHKEHIQSHSMPCPLFCAFMFRCRVSQFLWWLTGRVKC